jgi:dihydrofolate reductase
MARLIVNNAMTVNGAFEAPSPEEWLVLDDDSSTVSLHQFHVADAMVLGRKTYEGLAAVWPQLTDDPTLGRYADRINSMPKYVASRSLREPLEWNATLLEGDLAESVAAIKGRHQGDLIVSGAGELAHALLGLGLATDLPPLQPPAPPPRPAGPSASSGLPPRLRPPGPERAAAKAGMLRSILWYGILSVFLIVIWALSDSDIFWPVWPILGFMLLVAWQAINLWSRVGRYDDDPPRPWER